MRKGTIIFVSWLLLSWVSAIHAQGSLSVLTADPNLSTFVQALAVADASVQDALDSGQPFTVLAPSNQAFDKLAKYLNLPLETLLSYPEVVTALIQYHILIGRYTEADLREKVGKAIPTLLERAFVSVTTKDDGALSFNNVGEITQTDLDAGTIIVQVIDDGLLNRVVLEALAQAQLSVAVTLTPGNSATADTVGTTNPTATPTERTTLVTTPAPSATTPMPTTTTAETQPVANLRIAQLSPDVAPLNVFINGKLQQEGLTFGTVTDFLSVPPAPYEIALSTDIYDNALAKIDRLDLPDGAFVTVAVLGTLANDSLELRPFAEDYALTAPKSSKVLFINAIEGAPNVDVLLNDQTPISDVAYGEARTIDVVAQVSQPKILASETNKTLLELTQVSFWDGTYYIIVLAGTVNRPEWVASSTNADLAQQLRSGALIVDSFATTVQTVVNSNQTLFEIINSTAEYSIFREALDAADPEFTNRLSAMNQDLTVFVPTNQAFINLLATIGMSQGELFGDQSLLTEILEYHITRGTLDARELRALNQQSIITELAPKQAVYITLTSNDGILLNGFVSVIATDRVATNGIVHTIDNVLLPAVAIEALGL